ncbi:unnamed protein product [Phyllotreta striolata]|uniref:ascorbate ferrireductase (transmembrane) n=1 Tax=Phyllotreta striolata TaxID=444603 RepID=A0A9N9TN95_PHYSR|nr:unnamed protein product [Phyllotreta striolata]
MARSTSEKSIDNNIYTNSTSETQCSHDEDKTNANASNELCLIELNKGSIERLNTIPTDETERNNKNETRKSTFSSTLRSYLTLIAHFSIILYTGLILCMAFARPVEFFTWHPILLSFGWIFLLNEGVLLFSEDNFIGRKLRLSHTMKRRYHWLTIALGVTLVIIGFTIVIINKNIKNKVHFKTWHGLFGLIATIFCILTALNGTSALYDVKLKNYIKPALNKLLHVISGSISLIFGGLTLVLGVYSNWFIKASGNNTFLFSIGFVTSAYVTLWTLQRPMRKILSNYRSAGIIET